MQEIGEDDSHTEYLSQLVDRFSEEYGSESALARWASQAFSRRANETDTPSDTA
jgi:hypothetical protein